MNVWHVTEYCHAGSTGGTERYLLELVHGLLRRDCRTGIAWLCGPSDQPAQRVDSVDVVPVRSAASRIDPVDATFPARFTSAILEQQRPDLLHFHTFGFAEAAAAACARRLGIPYVFTYHSPAWTCRRGTLIRWGRVRCDGEVRALRCSACKLHERVGGPPAFAYAGALASAILGSPLASLTSGAWHRRTAFVLDVAHFGRDLRNFLAAASRVVACSEWSIPVLATNGAAPDRIVHLPQGVPVGFVNLANETLPPADAGRDETFVVGYVGRLTEVKGIHILVEAFRRTTYDRARLRVYGWNTNDNTEAYAREVIRLAARDPRITFEPSIPMEAMAREYRTLSLVAIPSVWLETGPMVLLEALQLGIPVWGSDHIGQLHLLRRHGRVIADNTATGWQASLQEAFTRHREGTWRAPSSPADAGAPLQTMDDVAADMGDLYRAITTERAV